MKDSLKASSEKIEEKKKPDKFVISYKNLSRKAPINQTLIAILIIKAFGLYTSIIGGIFIGIIFLMILFFWVIYVIDFIRHSERPVDIFKDQNLNNENNNDLRRDR